MLTFNTNINAQFSARMNSGSQEKINRTLQRLSSGLRINSARDDASGLAISDRMTAQIRGLNQAHRNINDGISLLQTAEGAMHEVTELLQRGRELALQASNATMTGSDKQALQAEVNQIKMEVTRISNTTSFNGQFLLKSSAGSGSSLLQDKLDVEDGLRAGWLENAEKLVTDGFGISGIDGDITVIFEEDSGDDRVAWVTNSFSTLTREAVTQELHIDLSDFTPVTHPDGGTEPYYNDRIIAHEVVHAIMGVSMNALDLNTWFQEGAAELIQGADERLLGVLNTRIASDGNLDNAVNNLVDTLNDPWGGGTAQDLNEQYATAYVALRFMHDEIKAAGGTGVDELMGLLSANKADNSYALDEALADIQAAHSSFAYANEAQFLTAFTAANGAGFDYLKQMYTSGDLDNSDTGAIGGLDADNGSVKTASSVVPNGAPYKEDPLEGFNTVWAEELKLTGRISAALDFQVGAEAGNLANVVVRSVSAQALNIADIDISVNPGSAIIKLDRAIGLVDENRGQLGAHMNRLEHALVVTSNMTENLSAARSRILDADIAFETSKLTRQRILQQAAISMLTQATSQPQLALQLLTG